MASHRLHHRQIPSLIHKLPPLPGKILKAFNELSKAFEGFHETLSVVQTGTREIKKANKVFIFT
jgi:hypothetical protein